MSWQTALPAHDSPLMGLLLCHRILLSVNGAQELLQNFQMGILRIKRGIVPQNDGSHDLSSMRLSGVSINQMERV